MHTVMILMIQILFVFFFIDFKDMDLLILTEVELIIYKSVL